MLEVKAKSVHHLLDLSLNTGNITKIVDVRSSDY
jgi:hypothetical protein